FGTRRQRQMCIRDRVAAVVRSGKQTTVTGDTLAVSFDGDDLHATEPFRIVSGPPAGLAVENLRMEGSIGSLSADFTKGPEGVRADVVADLTLPEAPAWAAAVPAGIWPAELTARVHASTADSTVARLRATGLQIGDRKDLEASLALDGQPDRVDAVLALVASNGDSLVAAKALLPAHVDLRALRLVREPGVFSVDGRLSGFPLPPEAAGGGGIAGYLDRSPVERTPKLDGRAVVTGTSGAPDAYLGGRILFPQYRELRDTEVRFEAILRQGTAPPSFPPDLAERPLYGRITEQAGDRHGFHALLAAVRGDRELLHGEAEYPVVVSLVPASAQPVAGEGMRASLDAPGLPLGDLTPLIPQVERLDGSARLHVEATGEAKDPNLDGSMTIPDLRVLLPDGTRATLHGTVYIAGRVQAPEVRGNVTVDNGTIQIPETPENLYPAQGEALLWEGGKTVEVRPDMAQAPTVAKDVRALRSEQTGAIAAVPVFAQLDSASARNRAVAAGEAEGGSEIMKRATIEVHLRIPSGVRLKGHGLDVELTGDIQVTQRNGIPILLGTMRAERGTMEFQGRSLDIESGTVTFYGSPELNPSLDLTLGKRVGDVAITVRLTGTLKQPNLAMSSDPPMSEADIMAMLLFGRPVDQLSNAQNQRLEDRVMATAEQYAADRLTSRLSRELGIDVLQFERSAGCLLYTSPSPRDS
ncbi:MAG: translocation/assembly module TamB domain-containing protein, partial [Candidatus Eisenbacteria bacterium]|nr:translocation/assembly module TamB domain-containing protein [Candidatus Eisenbacteria bacterium]